MAESRLDVVVNATRAVNGAAKAKKAIDSMARSAMAAEKALKAISSRSINIKVDARKLDTLAKTAAKTNESLRAISAKSVAVRVDARALGNLARSAEKIRASLDSLAAKSFKPTVDVSAFKKITNAAAAADKSLGKIDSRQIAPRVNLGELARLSTAADILKARLLDLNNLSINVRADGGNTAGFTTAIAAGARDARDALNSLNVAITATKNALDTIATKKVVITVDAKALNALAVTANAVNLALTKLEGRSVGVKADASQLLKLTRSANLAQKKLENIRDVSVAPKTDSTGIQNLATGASRAATELKKVSSAASSAGSALSGVGTGAAGVDKAAGSARRLKKDLDASTASAKLLKRAMATVSVGLVVRGFAQLSDAATQVRNRIRLVTGATEELDKVYKALFAQSQDARVEFSAQAELYQRIGLSAKQLGASQRDLLEATEAVSKAITLSASSAQAANATIIQFGQALAFGKLRGDELRSVLEQSPRLAQALADGLGITRGELVKFGFDGKVVSDQVFRALLTQLPKLREEFKLLKPTIAQATTVFKNSLTSAIDTANQVSGAADRMAAALINFGKIIEDPGVGIALGELLTKLLQFVNVVTEAANGLFRLGAVTSKFFAKSLTGDLGVELNDVIASVAKLETETVAAFKRIQDDSGITADRLKELSEATSGFTSFEVIPAVNLNEAQFLSEMRKVAETLAVEKARLERLGTIDIQFRAKEGSSDEFFRVIDTQEDKIRELRKFLEETVSTIPEQLIELEIGDLKKTVLLSFAIEDDALRGALLEQVVPQLEEDLQAAVRTAILAANQIQKVKGSFSTTENTIKDTDAAKEADIVSLKASLAQQEIEGLIASIREQRLETIELTEAEDALRTLRLALADIDDGKGTQAQSALTDEIERQVKAEFELLGVLTERKKVIDEFNDYNDGADERIDNLRKELLSLRGVTEAEQNRIAINERFVLSPEQEKLKETLEKQLSITTDLNEATEILRKLQELDKGVSQAQLSRITANADEENALRRLIAAQEKFNNTVNTATGVIEGSLTESEVLERQINEFRQAREQLEQGLRDGTIENSDRAQLQLETIDQAMLITSEGLSDLNEGFIDFGFSATQAVTQAAQDMSSALSDFFFDIMKADFDDLWKDLEKGFANAIDRMVADALAANLGNLLFNQLGGGSFLANTFFDGFGNGADGKPIEDKSKVEGSAEILAKLDATSNAEIATIQSSDQVSSEKVATRVGTAIAGVVKPNDPVAVPTPVTINPAQVTNVLNAVTVEFGPATLGVMENGFTRMIAAITAAGQGDAAAGLLGGIAPVAGMPDPQAQIAATIKSGEQISKSVGEVSSSVIKPNDPVTIAKPVEIVPPAVEEVTKPVTINYGQIAQMVAAFALGGAAGSASGGGTLGGVLGAFSSFLPAPFSLLAMVGSQYVGRESKSPPKEVAGKQFGGMVGPHETVEVAERGMEMLRIGERNLALPFNEDKTGTKPLSTIGQASSATQPTVFHDMGKTFLQMGNSSGFVIPAWRTRQMIEGQLSNPTPEAPVKADFTIGSDFVVGPEIFDTVEQSLTLKMAEQPALTGFFTSGPRNEESRFSPQLGSFFPSDPQEGGFVDRLPEFFGTHEQRRTDRLLGFEHGGFLGQGSFVEVNEKGQEALRLGSRKYLIPEAQQDIRRIDAPELITRGFQNGGPIAAGETARVAEQGSEILKMEARSFLLTDSGNDQRIGSATSEPRIPNRELGGTVSPRGIFEVNEGILPELLSIGSRDFLLTGGSSGYITPMENAGRLGNTQTINMTIVSPNPDGFRKTQNQITSEMGRAASIASRRNN